MIEDEVNKMHEHWWNFCEYMKEWYYRESNVLDENMEVVDVCKVFDSQKMIGYEAQIHCEEYAENHPEIKIISVDDDMFMSSDLVIIPHPKMGATCIFIPQSSTQNEFFLYPSAVKQIHEYGKQMLDNNFIP